MITRLPLSRDAVAVNGTIFTSNSAAVPGVAIILLGALAGGVVIGALSRCLIDAYAGLETGWRISLYFARDRLGPLLWLSVVVSVTVAIGFLFLVAPGGYLLVAFWVAIPVLMFERIGGLGAIRRSQQ